jgi:hypothetical protein
MLVQGETYEYRKAHLLECMAVGRQLIKQCQQIIKTSPENAALAKETMAINRGYVQDNYQMLVELERWRIKEGVDKNEQYYYKRVSSDND